ncbi:hypothetical protein I0D00_19525 [Pseudomonas lalucatii]|uniref:Uncharacterized protein n=1 Tax=Pseudomonas lalucatii TaxID=1424203 RepID=A0ABS5Q5S4_9PSED|nr:hypothetical protein [Pseudomonas lalucatii]MBS7664120.1 hypothetical protein [Pseudomonas lalucatii]MBS7725434.1 hypothetical protein [Pseudomonas lalucatii]QVM86624.1 hypothetical protein I0D68_12405 [Pseudomonas lalucatii]
MVRIRGRIGDWPVDLSLELDAEDWAQLAERLPAALAEPAAAPAPAPAAGASDALWQTALQLVRDAGQVEGPQLLGELATLAGGEAAGKRLLVRLRHCSQVSVEAGVDAPVYRWLGA